MHRCPTQMKLEHPYLAIMYYYTTHGTARCMLYYIITESQYGGIFQMLYNLYVQKCFICVYMYIENMVLKQIWHLCNVLSDMPFIWLLCEWYSIFVIYGYVHAYDWHQLLSQFCFFLALALPACRYVEARGSGQALSVCCVSEIVRILSVMWCMWNWLSVLFRFS